MPNTTLAKLRTGTRSEIKLDRLGKIWDNNEVNEAIITGIEEIESRGDFKFPQNEQNTTFNTVADQQEYSLKDNVPNYQGVKLVQYNGSTLSSTTYEELKRNYQEFQGGTPTHYYIYKGNIGFHPYPTSVQNIDVVYKQFTEYPELDTAVSPFPRSFDLAIKLYAGYTLLSQPGDNKNLARANSKLVRFKQQMARLFNSYLLPDRENIKYHTSYRSKSVQNARYGRVSNPNNL